MPEHYYPWQQTQWDYFTSLIAAGSLPHALLLSGQQGTGKRSFAKALVEAVLCQQPDDGGCACRQCKHCRLMAAGTYPDFMAVRPAADKPVISVEEIRELINKLYLTRHFNTYKIALIEGADSMNTHAANALLKTLEEPPEQTIIILVTDAPLTLPATLTSRCQSVPFYSPWQQQALAWLHGQFDQVDWEPLLRVAQGAPLQALQYYQSELLDQRISVIKGFIALFESNADLLGIAAELQSAPFSLSMQWIQSAILDLLRIKASENPVTLENPDFYRPLLALAPALPVSLLVELWELLMWQKGIFDNSLNRRLFTESLLVNSHRLAVKKSV